MNLRIVTTLLAAACLAPTAASAADQYAGSLEFTLGFANGWEMEPDEGDTIDGDNNMTLAVTPGLDRMLGKTVAIGAEWGFVWVQSDADDADRMLMHNPAVRARMSFPVAPKITFDSMLAVGPSIWTSANDQDSRYGWAMRFNFGGSYQFNKQVAAFGNLGYMTSTTYGDDVTMNMNSVPLNFGLRSAF